MANNNANQYPAWLIDVNGTVVAVPHDGGAVVKKSNENFAYKLGISTNGILWAISTTPDPDGGGAKIFWSTGDGNWTEINTSDPGAISITGYTDNACLYMDWDGNVRQLDTSGNATLLFSDPTLIDLDYGGGWLWAIRPASSGNIPVLQLAEYSGGNPNWKIFDGNITPYSLSVSYQGNCYCQVAGTPTYFSNDGSSTDKWGSGIDGQALQGSFKTWSFAITTDITENGNLLYEWQDISGGTFVSTNKRCSFVLASYYTAS